MESTVLITAAWIDVHGTGGAHPGYELGGALNPRKLYIGPKHIMYGQATTAHALQLRIPTEADGSQCYYYSSTRTEKTPVKLRHSGHSHSNGVDTTGGVHT